MPQLQQTCILQPATACCPRRNELLRFTNTCVAPCTPPAAEGVTLPGPSVQQPAGFSYPAAAPGGGSTYQAPGPQVASTAGAPVPAAQQPPSLAAQYQRQARYVVPAQQQPGRLPGSIASPRTAAPYGAAPAAGSWGATQQAAQQQYQQQAAPASARGAPAPTARLQQHDCGGAAAHCAGQQQPQHLQHSARGPASARGPPSINPYLLVREEAGDLCLSALEK